jgi:hypothetical protein
VVTIHYPEVRQYVQAAQPYALWTNMTLSTFWGLSLDGADASLAGVPVFEALTVGEQTHLKEKREPISLQNVPARALRQAAECLMQKSDAYLYFVQNKAATANDAVSLLRGGTIDANLGLWLSPDAPPHSLNGGIQQGLYWE